MGESVLLTNQDWRNIARLWNELKELPVGDYQGNLRHLLAGVRLLVGGHRAFWIVGQRQPETPVREDDPLDGWRPVELMHDPFEAWQYRFVSDWARSEDNFIYDRHTQRMVQHAGRHRAFLRSDLVDERTWQLCPAVNELLRPMGIADQLTAAYHVAEHVEVYVGVNRPLNGRRFRLKERELLQTAVEGLGWFFRQQLTLSARLQGKRLSPREFELVQCLLTGASEKEIACQLGLSAGTVHQYVVGIYRKYDVHSRAELMALWLSPTNP